MTPEQRGEETARVDVDAEFIRDLRDQYRGYVEQATEMIEKGHEAVCWVVQRDSFKPQGRSVDPRPRSPRGRREPAPTPTEKVPYA